jgi:hypothetical protein
MRKDAPLTVDVPSADRDSPGWVKVGVIAAVGFVIGIAWPRVMGVRLGPSAPGESTASASSGSSSSGGAASTPASTTAAAAAAASAGAAGAKSQPSTASAALVASGAAASASAAAKSAPPAPPHVRVRSGAVLSCKTDDGGTKKGKACGKIPSLDQVVVPRLRTVAQCAGAEGQTGKLSFMATADFTSGRFSWDFGRSTTVGNLDQLRACLKTTFHGVTVKGAAHDNPRYTVAYNAMFTAPAASKDDGDEDERGASGAAAEHASAGAKANAKADAPKSEKSDAQPVSGDATVGWEVALVREVPKTGGIVARLPRGTKVKLGAAKDGWYSIKYGDGFAGEGWVYRGAIGR